MKIDIHINEIYEYLKELMFHARNDSVALMKAELDEVSPGVWRMTLLYKVLE